MKLLAIETSCDETAITVLEGTGDTTHADFRILGNALLSQIDIHREFGGVFPAVAKREHAKNIVPMLHASLSNAGLLREETRTLSESEIQTITEILSREPETAAALIAFLSQYAVPDIDVLAVTHGPGLEPALWVGVNFTRALAHAWQKPIVGVNHMEGHLLSALATPNPDDDRAFSLTNITLPVLGLLISGGHTELVLMESWLSYRLVGRTRDDAVGEAFDKAGRMLGLPYPGGPEISARAEKSRAEGRTELPVLPRPMLHDDSCDFSFSGLKTAVRYRIPDLVGDNEMTEEVREILSHAFEDAAGDVLLAKTLRALEATNAQSVALGGGVSANNHIRTIFAQKLAETHPHINLFLPEFRFCTDNAIMIGIAGFFHALQEKYIPAAELRANGNLRLTEHS